MYYWYYALQQSTQQTNNQVFHAITGILQISIWTWGSALQTKNLRIKRTQSFVKYSLKSCSVHQNRMRLHSKSGELFWWRYCIYHGAVDTGNLRVKQHEHCICNRFTKQTLNAGWGEKRTLQWNWHGGTNGSFSSDLSCTFHVLLTVFLSS